MIGERVSEPVFGFETAAFQQADARKRTDGRLLNLVQRSIAVACIGIVLVAPIPLASNRPAIWLTWSSALFGLMALHLAVCASHGSVAFPHLRRFRVCAALTLVVLAFLFAPTLALLFPPLTTLPPFQSAAAGASLLGAIRWAGYVALFLLLLHVSRAAERTRLLGWVLFLGVAAHAVFALTSFRFFDNATLFGLREHYVTSVAGTFINRNSFATFVGFGVILGCALALEAGERARRRFRVSRSLESFYLAIVAWLLVTFLLLALFGTSSRMGILATLAGLATVIALHHLTARRSRSFSLGLPGIALLVTLIAIVVVTSDYDVMHRSFFLVADSAERIALYRQVADLIAINSWHGSGFDAFEIAFQSIRHPPVSADVIWDRAHSTYLTLWAEIGFPIGTLPPLIVALILAQITRSVLSRSRPVPLEIAALGAGVLAALHSTVDFSLEIPASVFLFLAILSLAASERFHSRHLELKRHHPRG